MSVRVAGLDRVGDVGVGRCGAGEMVTVIQAYRFALDPTAGQHSALRSHCGAQRYAFNRGVARVRANLDQRAAEKTYDIPGDQLTPPVSWSAYSLREDWNQAENEVAPWWAENSKEAYSSGLANLAAALGNWAASTKGTRQGPRLGFPRFKGRRSGSSCRFTTGAFGLGVDRRHVTLPRIGAVRTNESTREPARHVERGTARIRSATVSRRVGRWFVAFSVEITRADPAPTRPESVVGSVVIEDLNVSGMLRNPRLARHIAGVGMSELRRQIEYRAGWAGVRVHVADRWCPSSKTCSACGVMKAKLRLSDRVYRCEACGLVCDRDLNAARNLAALARRETSSPSCGATVNEPAGNPCKTRAKRATGTATGRPAPPGTGQRRRRKATTA